MTTKRLRVLAVSALAVAFLAAAGCGGSDDEDPVKVSEEDQVENAVKDLAKAGKDKDFGKVCDGLAKDAKKQVEKLGQGGCEKTLEKAGEQFSSAIPDPDDLKIKKVKVDGDKATAEIDGEEANFSKEDGDWKISPE